MRIIGVIDLLHGRAVHARGGRRDAYAPVSAVAGVTIPAGDPRALAREYVDTLGIRDLYVADLDAITTGVAPTPLIADLSAAGCLWVDAAVSGPPRAQQVRALGAQMVIVGLETLSADEDVDAVCAAVGGSHVAFSLDLRNGVPIAQAGRPPDAIAARAARAGVAAIIVLDLARVGAGTGVDLAVIRRVRDAAPDVLLLAGGGVRDMADLTLLAGAGCDGALVASALLSGHLDVRSAMVAQAGRSS